MLKVDMIKVYMARLHMPKVYMLKLCMLKVCMVKLYMLTVYVVKLATTKPHMVKVCMNKGRALLDGALHGQTLHVQIEALLLHEAYCLMLFKLDTQCSMQRQAHFFLHNAWRHHTITL